MSSPASYPFYVWEVPEQSISIHLHFGVIDAIYREVMKGFGAIPRRGAEVGGLLIGRSQLKDKRTVYIEEHEPLACEYFYGPSFHLSENDARNLEEALSCWRPGLDRQMWVVGYYRSHTRTDLNLSADDLALCSKYFSDPGNVFLLIKPFASRTPSAGFFFWENGQIRSEATYLEFPFQSREPGGVEAGYLQPQLMTARTAVEALKSERPAAGELASDAGAVEESPDLRPLAALSAPSAIAPPRQSRWLWFPLVGIILVMAGFLSWQIVKNESSAKLQKVQQIGSMAYPIGLRVAENQHELHVSWDRNSPAVLGAERAILSITDGIYRKDLDFNASQIRNGSLVYSRITGDVSFELKLFNRQGLSTSETVRAFRAEPALAGPVNIPEPLPLRPAQTAPSLPIGVKAPSGAIKLPQPKRRLTRGSSLAPSHSTGHKSTNSAGMQSQEDAPALPELERPDRRR